MSRSPSDSTIAHLAAAAVVLIAAGSGCEPGIDTQTYIGASAGYDVVVHRDTWGVPHVFGATAPDVAFGLAFAQAEDAWSIIEGSIPFYRGNRASFDGGDAVATDYLVQWLEIWPTIETRMNRDLTADTRKYLTAFADGLNYWAALNPDRIERDILPITAQDLVAGYMLRHLLFYGFQDTVEALNAPDGPRPSPPKPVSADGLPIGSNAFAVAPGQTTDGATRLAINSHQPTTGPVAWYEARVHSEDGLDFMGGLFPGGPTFGVGFNRRVAWAATVNRPDLVDVYALEIHPDDPNRYRLDGEWQALAAKPARIEVRLIGPLTWTFERERLYSEHGPVLRTGNGTYAVRYAGMGELRQVEQWLTMMRANSLDDWWTAMRMHTFASFNFVAADAGGNIGFVHNALLPVRVPGYDWRGYLPGDESRLIWRETLPFDALPHVINPVSGYLVSANQTPFRVSGGDNPDPAEFAPELGFQTRMTNRAHRALELFDAWRPIDENEFSSIKHDKTYSRQSLGYRYLAGLFDMPRPGDPLLAAARDLIESWDLTADVDSRAAALGTCVLAREWSAEQDGVAPPAVDSAFRDCVAVLTETLGRIDPLWGDVNRHVRGSVDLPVGGGPDTLRAIYGRGLETDGYLTNVAGDGLYYLVAWDNQGTQHVRGIHHFGSAVTDRTSPHFADQAPLYAAERLKDPHFEPAALMANLEESYRPGKRQSSGTNRH